MDIQQLLWNEEYGWRPVEAGEPVDFVEKPIDEQLVLYFGAASVFEKVPVYEELKRRYPYAHIVGIECATGLWPLSADRRYHGDGYPLPRCGSACGIDGAEAP